IVGNAKPNAKRCNGVDDRSTPLCSVRPLPWQGMAQCGAPRAATNKCARGHTQGDGDESQPFPTARCRLLGSSAQPAWSAGAAAFDNWAANRRAVELWLQVAVRSLCHRLLLDSG